MKKITLIAAIIAATAMANCSTTDSTTDTTDSGCTSTPSYDATLVASTSTSASHNFGQDCMSGCHTAGGSATTVWTVAGSLTTSNNGTTPASAGVTVTNIGANLVTVTVDTCGNFYTTSAVGVLDGSRPVASLTMGQNSWLNNPTSDPAIDALNGSCNQSGCHTTADTGYVY